VSTGQAGLSLGPRPNARGIEGQRDRETEQTMAWQTTNVQALLTPAQNVDLKLELELELIRLRCGHNNEVSNVVFICCENIREE